MVIDTKYGGESPRKDFTNDAHLLLDFKSEALDLLLSKYKLFFQSCEPLFLLLDIQGHISSFALVISGHLLAQSQSGADACLPLRISRGFLFRVGFLILIEQVFRHRWWNSYVLDEEPIDRVHSDEALHECVENYADQCEEFELSCGG